MVLVRLTTRWRCPIPGKPDSVFGLRIFAQDAECVAILTERPDNPGPTLVNEPIAVAGVLWEALGQPTSFRLFEHTPPRPGATSPYDQVDQYTRVATVVRERRLVLSGYQHTPAEELEAVVGQPLRWFPIWPAMAAALRAAGFTAAAAGQPGFHVHPPDYPYALDARIDYRAPGALPEQLHAELEGYHDALRAAGFDAWIPGGTQYVRCRWLPNTRVPGRLSDLDEERAFHALRYDLAHEARDADGYARVDTETVSEVLDLAEHDPVLAAMLTVIDERLDDALPVQVEARRGSRALLQQALARARRDAVA